MNLPAVPSQPPTTIDIQTSSWTPLLDGTLGAHARAAVADIADALLTAPPMAGWPRACAASELALLYGYLSRVGGTAQTAQVAARCVDQAIESVAAERLSPALYGGFTEVAWALEHMHGASTEADLDDPNEEIDQVLLSHIQQSPWRRDYDLISGLVGFGVYAFERLPRPAAAECLEQVVARLAELAEQQPAGATWWTDPRLLPPQARAESPQGYYNLGLAHGVPGVIGLLASACAAGVAAETARPLLDEAVRWLLAQRLPEGAGASFGYWVGPAVSPQPARLAWCYGDLGIAAALLCAARCVGQPEWERVAIDIARAAAARPVDRSGAIDAGLCHGSAGIGHLFNRLYQATGEETLASAARFWFERTLELRQPNSGIGGFAAWEPAADGKMAWVDDPGFLNGAAGIGLALLAATTTIEPAWDRLLLVAIRSHPTLGPL